MSEERDRELSRHYRAASAEMPPPASGRALRAAAAEALAAPPRGWHRKWGAPLAMAASVVLGLGMVLRVALERSDLQPTPALSSAPAAAPAPAPAVVQRSASAPAPAGEPAAKAQAGPDAAARADTAASQATRQLAQQPVTSDKKLAPSPPREGSIAEAKPQTSPATQAGVPAAPMRDLARAEPPMRLPPAASAPAPASESLRSQSPSMAESTAGQPAGTTANAAAQERRAASAMAPAARAKALGAGAAQGADSADLSIVAEADLAADEWLRRIVVLRGAARHVEADASLARFMRRYPDYRIPGEARAPKP